MRAIRLLGETTSGGERLPWSEAASYRGRRWHDVRLSMDDVPSPSRSSGHVVLEPQVCGLCGTDFAVCRHNGADGTVCFKGPLALPVTLGHEFCGIVVEAPNESELAVGELVAVESIVACGSCPSCRRGYRDCCRHISLVGLTYDGALADYVAVPASCCRSLRHLQATYGNQEDLLLAGAMVEPFGCAYNALFCAHRGFQPGCTVCVYGVGGLGIAAMYLAAVAGAGRVLGVDNMSSRSGFCSTVLPPWVPVAHLDGGSSDELSRGIRESTGGRGIDVAVICDGGGQLPPQAAIDNLAPGGRMVLLTRGMLSGGVQNDVLVDNAAAVVGVRGQSSHNAMGRVIELMEGGVLRPERLVQRVVDFDEAVAVLSAPADRTIPPGRTAVAIGVKGETAEFLRTSLRTGGR